MQNIMQNIMSLKLVSYPFLGLCNQLYSIAGTLTEAIHLKKEILIVDNFQSDIYTHDFVPLDEVLDLYKTNLFLEKYNIKLLSSNNLDLKIKKITFGKDDKIVDITNEMLGCDDGDGVFCKNNIFHFSNDINLIALKGDPIPNVGKMLYIEYEISGYTFKKEYEEKYCVLVEPIYINLNLIYLKNETVKKWDTPENKIIFEEILENLHFHSKYKFRANKVIQSLNLKKNVNVIHLRMEEDALLHWSKLNNMDTLYFKHKLEDKYMTLIEKYINPQDITIILTYDKVNNITDTLKTKNYNFYYTEKHPEQGREINAIQDMCIGECCNNIFIGPTISSTFSHVLHKRITDHKTTISFDMENIESPEIILKN